VAADAAKATIDVATSLIMRLGIGAPERTGSYPAPTCDLK
jgi:hypothetical protein